MSNKTNHKFGKWFAGLLLAVWVSFYIAYQNLRSPVEASLAARQVEDSAATWNLVHNVTQNDAIIWVVSIVFLFLIGISLYPTIRDAIKIN